MTSPSLARPITTNLNKYILIFVDNFFRYIEAEPLTAVNGEIVSNTLVKKIVCRHSCPSTLICDNASYYVHGEFERACKYFGIKMAPSTAYHPEAKKRNCRVKSKSFKSSAQIIGKTRQIQLGLQVTICSFCIQHFV